MGAGEVWLSLPLFTISHSFLCCVAVLLRWCTCASAPPGITQGRYAWKMRLNDNIRRVYAHMHGVGPEELVVGMDASFFKPFHAPPRDATHLWGHCDHNSHDEQVGGWDVYQSVATLWPAQCGADSTTVVWPRSHKVREKQAPPQP